MLRKLNQTREKKGGEKKEAQPRHRAIRPGRVTVVIIASHGAKEMAARPKDMTL